MYPNYYAILGIETDAPLTTIRRAHRARMLAQRKHPDLGGSTNEAVLLNEAYAVLKDPVRRQAYHQIYLQHVAIVPPPTPVPEREIERRRAQRRAYTGHLYVRFGSATAHAAQCRDISGFGLSFRALAKPSNGGAVSVTFAEDPGLTVAGKVRWSRMLPQRFGPPLYEIGMEFADVHPPRFHEFYERVGIGQ